MSKYRTLAIATRFWRPHDDFLEEIVKSVKPSTAEGDFVVISEKAISTGQGNVVDENQVRARIVANIIAVIWMRVIWGYFLGPICHFHPVMLERFRKYPSEAGSRHKQVALHHCGPLHALMFGSEGGIDGSNLPYSYVSLPLNNAQELTDQIRAEIRTKANKRVNVMIVDTDKTYSFRNFHFTSRPGPIKGIHPFGGVVAFVIGRMLMLKMRSTPLAISGCKISTETALDIAEMANHARGFGAGRTVWDMAEKFHVRLSEVSWEMLDTVKHKPIVLVRRKR